jgi:Mg2+ and Co2+ transporter CorA
LEEREKNLTTQTENKSSLGKEKMRKNENSKVQAARKSGKREEDKLKELLMVSQLWLWNIQDVCLTAFSSREMALNNNLYDMQRMELYDASPEALIKLSGLQMTAFIISTCIHAVERPYSSGLEEPIFTTFDRAITGVSEKVRQYMKDGGLDNINIEKEQQYIFEISDVRDELAMIRNVITQQQLVWSAFWEDSKEDLWKKDGDGKVIDDHTRTEFQKTIERPNTELPKLQERIKRLDDDAERVERWILVQLDIKAKHAALRESHNSTVLSTAVIGFTVITIIFTPLAFFASLFALPIDQFQRSQTASAYTSSYIAKWMSKCSLPVTEKVLTVCSRWRSDLLVNHDWCGIVIPVMAEAGSTHPEQDEMGGLEAYREAYRGGYRARNLV